MIAEANSKNPELWTNKIQLSDHAYERVAERMGIKDKTQALGKIRNMLRQAHKIGTVYGEDGNEGVYYTFNKFGIILTPDLQCVVTIKKTETVADALKAKILELHKNEFNKLDRLERSKRKRQTLEKLRINAEIAQLEYRRVKTRSRNVKQHCKEQISFLKKEVSALDKEIREIQSLKRQVANSLSAIL